MMRGQRGGSPPSSDTKRAGSCCRATVTPAALVAVLYIAAVFPTTFSFCSPRMHTKGSVQVCTNTSCRKAGSRWTLDTFRAFAPSDVKVVESGCQGRCGLGPNILTRPSEEVYNGVAQPATVAAIIEIDFGFPVPDALVGAYGYVSEGDVLFKRGLFSDASVCYTKCVDTVGAFEGSPNALSVAKVKQSSAMLMAAKEEKRKTSAAASGTILERAEDAARDAVELWPANVAAWLNLADVLADTGRVPEALEMLATLKQDFPDAKFEASEKAAQIRSAGY